MMGIALEQAPEFVARRRGKLLFGTAGQQSPGEAGDERVARCMRMGDLRRLGIPAARSAMEFVRLPTNRRVERGSQLQI